MSQNNKYGIREILNVVFKAKVDTKIGDQMFVAGQPVIYFDTLKTSSLEEASTTVYAQGGRGNPRLVSWSGEKTLTLNMEDALISPVGLAILMGAGLVTPSAAKPLSIHIFSEGALDAVSGTPSIAFNLNGPLDEQKDMWINVLDEDGSLLSPILVPKATLQGIAEDGTATACSWTTTNGVNAIAIGGTGVNIKYNKTNLTYEMDFTTGSLPAAIVLEGGTLVHFDFYVLIESGATGMQIESGKFAGSFTIEGEGLWRSQKDGNDYPVSIYIGNGKVSADSVTINYAATGDPSTFAFKVECLEFRSPHNGKKVLVEMNILEDSIADD